MSIYDNGMYKVDINESQDGEKDYLLYQTINIETGVVEYESSMMIEAFEAADFLKEKMDIRNQKNKLKLKVVKDVKSDIH